jgi:pimeloyl-ACP methyl ester carboxylesterase
VKLAALLVLIALSACSSSREQARAARAPRLSELPLEPDVKASGSKLMSAPDGLHRLDAGGATPLAVVAVHGGRSEGYEWIYALHTLARQGARIYFFRYDDHACPDAAARKLASALEPLVQDPSVAQLRVLGHSYGGVVSALWASTYRGPKPLEVELIAAPLRGLDSLNTRCRYAAPSFAASAQVTVHQWRTQKAVDGVFKDLPADPQRHDIPGSQVVTLPDEYRGHRLGHNWSISWVADRLVQAAR